MLTYVLFDLCIHPEYLKPLRQEIQDNWTEDGLVSADMPLLDSFIKTSTQLNGMGWSKS
jgi:hypothetical protein